MRRETGALFYPDTQKSGLSPQAPNKQTLKNEPQLSPMSDKYFFIPRLCCNTAAQVFRSHGDIKALFRGCSVQRQGRHSHARPGPGSHSFLSPATTKGNQQGLTTLHSSHWSNNWSSHWSNMGQLQGQKPRRSSRNAARIRHTATDTMTVPCQAHNPGLPVPMATVSF